MGAQKAGTTSLYDWLVSQSKSFYLPSQKEFHFFNRGRQGSHSREFEEYLSHFRAARPDQIMGEITPNYLGHRLAPSRVKGLMPDVKLVVILRNPVDRAESAFLHAIRSEAVDPRWDWYSMYERDLTEKRGWTSIVEEGIYDRHLERWLKYFDWDAIRLLTFDELLAPDREALYSLTEWLNPAWSQSLEQASFPHSNQATDTFAGAPNYYPMPQDVREVLKDFYEPHMLRTREIVGRPMDELLA